jgi:coniferyl-aldehyde dehydrogenase
MGRHHGIEGFREFSNPRGVVTRPKGNQDMIGAFAPPYAVLGEPLAEAAYKQAMGLARTQGHREKFNVAELWA